MRVSPFLSLLFFGAVFLLPFSVSADIGSVCYGSTTGTAGTCQSMTNCQTANTEAAAECQGLVCCTGSGAAGTGGSGSNQQGGGTGSGGGSGSGFTSTDTYCVGRSIGANCTRPSGSGDCRNMSGVLTCVSNIYSGSGSGSGTGGGMYGAGSGSGGYGFVNCPNGIVRSGVCFPATTGLSDAPVWFLLMRLMNWLLAIFGMIAIIAFVISGLQYLLATGDEGMAERAKTNMKYSIIGVIVALSAWIVINAIDNALNGWSFWYF